MIVRNMMANYIYLSLSVATKNVKDVEVFKVNVLNLLTMKAKY